MSFGIDRDGIEETARVISPFLRETPVVRANGCDFGLAGFPLTLKLELLQHSGSFKARGAFANLKLRPLPEAGVVAASGGNHGVAVAYAAMRLSVPARIYLPAGTWAYTWYDARTAFVRASGQVTGGVQASIPSPAVSKWNGPSGLVLKVVRTGP